VVVLAVADATNPLNSKTLRNKLRDFRQTRPVRSGGSCSSPRTLALTRSQRRARPHPRRLSSAIVVQPLRSSGWSRRIGPCHAASAANFANPSAQTDHISSGPTTSDANDTPSRPQVLRLIPAESEHWPKRKLIRGVDVGLEMSTPIVQRSVELKRPARVSSSAPPSAHECLKPPTRSRRRRLEPQLNPSLRVEPDSITRPTRPCLRQGQDSLPTRRSDLGRSANRVR
jgi:hypothetical protein